MGLTFLNLKPENKNQDKIMQTQRTTDEFKNEPFTDYSEPENADAMRQAIEQVKGELGRDYPALINGERIEMEKKFESYNPAERTQVVGSFSDADADAENLVNQAIDAATEAFKTWRNVPAAERADYLFRAAQIIRERKHYYSAWMVFEVGKTWAEADGDTAEAIDFLEFYGREMLRYAQKQPITPIAGEDNRLEYIPAGDYGGNDDGGGCNGKHDRSQTFARCANDRL